MNIPHFPKESEIAPLHVSERDTLIFRYNSLEQKYNAAFEERTQRLSEYGDYMHGLRSSCPWWMDQSREARVTEQHDTEALKKLRDEQAKHYFKIVDKFLDETLAEMQAIKEALGVE